MNKEKPVPVLWIDLDGTVRHGKDELGYFANKTSDVHLFDGVREILHAYKANGWRVVAISNQGGVAVGHLTMTEMMAMMAETQRQSGDAFDKISACTHHPDAPTAEMAICWCRKPRIGQLVECGLEMARQFNECYPPHLGLFVGDRPEDEQCAANAGLRFVDAKQWRNGRWREFL